MPSSRNKQLVNCAYFDWQIYQRPNEYWYVDGRHNGSGTKRTSLGARDRKEAIRNLHQFDRLTAEDLGLVPRSRSGTNSKVLLLAEGREQFEKHLRRPKTLGGTAQSTQKRYRAHHDNFFDFARPSGISSWSQVTESVLTDFATSLDEKGYAPKTIYGAVSAIKTTFRWFCNEGLLDRDPLHLPMTKVESEPALSLIHI